jgi:hypothetical protein
MSFGRRRFALAMGTLAGALMACASAQAQSAVDIQDRIAATFDLVLNNSPELAVPLTRRALERRSREREAEVEPLPYRPTAEADVESSEIEEGSADDMADSAGADEALPDGIEIARLPRPRPVITSAATGEDNLLGRPLDLVAGAAVPVPPRDDAEDAIHLAEVAAPPDAVVREEEAAPREVKEDEEEEDGTVLVPLSEPATEPELVAAGTCLSVSDVTDKDGDFKRNAEVLSGSGFCIAEEAFKERKRGWIIQTVSTGRSGPLWAIMHDDEAPSFDTAVQAIRSYGGTLVTVETGGKRNLSGVDPNRNFSGEGIGCRKLGDGAAPRFTKFFADLIDPDQPIIALHNNHDGAIATGGLGHVSMDLVSKDMRSFPAPDPDGPLAGDHALVLLATPDLDDPLSASRAAALNEKGVNVVLERVQEDRGDCSLSNFAVLTGNPNYFNVTVHHDEAEKQRRIVDILMSGRSETVASQ